MALPAENSAWPPAQDAGRYDQMKVNLIWYEGDPEKLTNMYKGGHIESADAGVDAGFKTRIWKVVHRWFWGTEAGTGEKDTKIHIPVAQDIATLSSELLFAEPPTVKLDVPPLVQPKAPPKPSPVTGTLPPDPLTGVVPEIGTPPTDPVTGEVQTEEVEDPKGIEAQETLEWLLDRVGWQSLLLAAAETQAPLGSVALRIAWDAEVDSQAPFLTRVDANACLPEYRWGKLVGVTFWTTIINTKARVVRFFERYTPGQVEYAVYEGSYDNIGKRKPFTDYPQLEWVSKVEGLNGDTVLYPELSGMLLAQSVPNMLPDPSDLPSAIGRSDFTPGVRTLFDSIDEIASSLMRDIYLGKGRVFLARYMLEDKGAGQGASFNEDQAYFSPLRMNPGEKDEAPIVANQFNIRVEEHLKAIEWYSAKAVRAAGYNPDSDFGQAGQDMTATEYSGRNKRSMSTRSKKILYWQNALEQIVTALIKVYNLKFASLPGAPRPAIPEEWPVKVEFPPGVHPDLKYLAETVQALSAAKAASTKVMVQLVHPDWTDREVEDEVARIQEDTKAASAIDPATFGLAPGAGLGAAPDISTPSPFGGNANAGQPNAQ